MLEYPVWKMVSWSCWQLQSVAVSPWIWVIQAEQGQRVTILPILWVFVPSFHILASLGLLVKGGNLKFCLPFARPLHWLWLFRMPGTLYIVS